jgi:isocitrate dehydrogenase kinase/phosphatase
MNLPREPGLYRRLAYGEYIRTRHRSRITFDTYQNSDYMEDLDYRNLVELQDVKNGLSDKELSVVFKNDVLVNEFFCSICQEQQNQHQTFANKTLICDHTFHNRCIKKWLSKNKSCPICRFDLSSD